MFCHKIQDLNNQVTYNTLCIYGNRKTAKQKKLQTVSTQFLCTDTSCGTNCHFSAC